MLAILSAQLTLSLTKGRAHDACLSRAFSHCEPALGGHSHQRYLAQLGVEKVIMAGRVLGRPGLLEEDRDDPQKGRRAGQKVRRRLIDPQEPQWLLRLESSSRGTCIVLDLLAAHKAAWLAFN